MANVLALALVLIVIAAGDNRGIIMAGAHTPSSPNSSSSLCGASLASLTPCLGSLQSGVNNSTPTQGCCTALASAVDSSAVCVSQLFTTTNNPLGIPINNISQGIPINQSGALNLPGACKITTPPVSQCKSPAGNLMDYLQKLAHIESQIVDLKNVIPLKKQRFSINQSIQKLPYIERRIGSSSVIVVGAGISGIVAAKVLAENGVEDFLILEAADRIGGRLMKHEFAGFTVECGAGWVAGVGGNKINPIWELANKYSVRTCYSDYSNAAFNIYDESGARVPGSVAAACYKLAVDSAHRALAIEATSRMADGTERANVDLPSQATKIQEAIPLTPLELAIDYWLHDFEMAEVEPMPTYTEFGAREFMVADDRGYEYIVHKLAQEFLESEGGHVVDDRLKMKKVVREIQYTNDGVTIKVEDGSVYSGKYAIVSVSLGVLQSDLIKFNPPLHSWKRKAFFSCQMRVYTKIFLKFPSKFWPTGDGSEFFLYAHEKRGYYTFWQNMEAAYSGSNILVVTVTDEESKRIEEQGDDKTKAEAMAVLRKIFGDGIPEAEQILIPRWWNNRFQRGSYSNYPIFVNPKHFDDIKTPVGPVYFTGEHTSQKFSGYVHGAYLSGIDTAKMVIESMKKKQNAEQG